MQKKKALISVSDKTGIVEFAGELKSVGYEMLSTGGTAQLLKEKGIEVTKVSDVTGFPEIMNGRVKTLHPLIHGGILGDRDNENHMKQASELGIEWIDLVVVNLYPFEKTLQKDEVSEAEIIENIDIGGPTMVRASAKNFHHVTIITNPDDYNAVLTEIKLKGNTTLETRKRLAGVAFTHTADYDSVIADYFNKEKGKCLQLSVPAEEILRYGENPHQAAIYYQKKSVAVFEQLHGKHLSFNNYLDIDAALKIILKFSEPCAAIIKHTNPCGIGVGETLNEAYLKAFETDTLSPYGGIVIVNRKLDIYTAESINQIFTEIIIAPDYEEEAMNKLLKKKNRRLIKYFPEKLDELGKNWSIRSCLSGYLAQEHDLKNDDQISWRVVTKRVPSETEMKALIFSWKTVATLKSNAVCFTKEDRTIGLGIGQTSRIDATEIAVNKAAKFNLDLKGSICASDAFFPFRDSIDHIAGLGITAVIQPGGSTGDEEVITACNEHNIAMIFTDKRHFRH